MSRKKINYEIKKELFKKFNGQCFICGQNFTQIHHIIPYSIDKNNNIENLVPVCASCHNVLTASSHLFSPSIQIKFRNDALKVFNGLKKIDNNLLKNNYAEALDLFFSMNLFEQLVHLGWYNKAEKYLLHFFKKFDTYSFNKKNILIMAIAELNFWQGKHIESKLFLDRLKGKLNSLDSNFQAWYYDILGRVISYLSDEPKLRYITNNKYSQKDALKAYEIALIKSKDNDQKGRIYSSISSSLMSLKEYYLAEKYCSYAIKLSRKTNALLGERSNLDRIASIYLKNNEFKYSTKILIDTLKLSMNLNYKRGISYTLRSLSRSFLGQNDIENATIALMLASFFANIFNDPNFIWLENLRLEIIRKINDKNFERLYTDINIKWWSYLSNFLK